MRTIRVLHTNRKYHIFAMEAIHGRKSHRCPKPVKQYPKVRAVDDVSFQWIRGIFGLLGPTARAKHHHTRPVDAYPAHVRGNTYL